MVYNTLMVTIWICKEKTIEEIVKFFVGYLKVS